MGGKSVDMEKPSETLDLLDKITELRNCYVDEQKHAISSEIKWICENADNVDILRKYLSQLLKNGKEMQLSNDSIKELAQIRANHLYSDLNGLGTKIDNFPLKVIVQYLKDCGL